MSRDIEQIEDMFCYWLGEWYLNAKELTNKGHNLGVEKEIFKLSICRLINVFCTTWEKKLENLGRSE